MSDAETTMAHAGRVWLGTLAGMMVGLGFLSLQMHGAAQYTCVIWFGLAGFSWRASYV